MGDRTAKEESSFEYELSGGLLWVGGVMPNGTKTWVAAKPGECAEIAALLIAERDGLRSALQRIAANSSGLVRRAATQALEGKFA